MIRFLSIVLAVFLVVQADPANAEKRIALVIGNANYQHAPALDNPVNDAQMINKTLRSVGFDTIEVLDADRMAMERAVRDFGRRLSAAGPDAVGLFYYAGHGVQADGINYMIPVSAKIEREADLTFESVSTQVVMDQIAFAGNNLNILILDACRDNPYSKKTRGGSRGLASMRAPSGTFLAFAAAPGQTALDGTGPNSPYSEAINEQLRVRGLKVEDVFKRVRRQVKQVTGDRQEPWENTSLTGDFYFLPPMVSASGGEAGTQGTIVAPRNDASEIAYWNAIKDSADWREFQTYIDQFGADGIFYNIAALRRDKLRQEEDTTLMAESATKSIVINDPGAATAAGTAGAAAATTNQALQPVVTAQPTVQMPAAQPTATQTTTAQQPAPQPATQTQQLQQQAALPSPTQPTHGSYGGEWKFRLWSDDVLPNSEEQTIVVRDNEFHVKIEANGWTGTASGQVDATGYVKGSSYLRKGNRKMVVRWKGSLAGGGYLARTTSSGFSDSANFKISMKR
jgi:hypothetical protein